MKGASVGSGDAVLDHDLVVWFGDFHSSIVGLEPVSLGSGWQALGLIYLTCNLKGLVTQHVV